MRHFFDRAAGASNGSLDVRAREVAGVAAAEADAVDSKGMFPKAAIEAAKRSQLLSLMIPVDLGGEGASVSDVAEVCFTLATSCASTAMIYAMHNAALSCVVRHCDKSPWHEAFLRRVVVEQCLLASSTTEGNQGGNVRSSAAPLIKTDDRVSLERAATVMSYGAEADAIVTTAKRQADGGSSDQALAVFFKEDYELSETGTWKTLGMRGTRSAGFALRASAPASQVIPVLYKTIHTRTMVPISHLLWCSVWVGVAASAVSRAQAFVRTSVRKTGGTMPPGAPYYTKAVATLGGLQARLKTALIEHEEIRDDPASLEAVGTQTSLNLLKVDISEGAEEVVGMAMRACGLAGYREDGEFSIARHLRDILSAPIMIHNERIISNIAAAALLSPVINSIGTR